MKDEKELLVIRISGKNIACTAKKTNKKATKKAPKTKKKSSKKAGKKVSKHKSKSRRMGFQPRKLPTKKALEKAAYAVFFKEIEKVDPTVKTPKTPEPTWLPQPGNIAEEKVLETEVVAVAAPILADAKKSRTKAAKKAVTAIEKVLRKGPKAWKTLKQAPLWEDVEPAPAAYKPPTPEYLKRLLTLDYSSAKPLISDLRSLEYGARNALPTDSIRESLAEVLQKMQDAWSYIEEIAGHEEYRAIQLAKDRNAKESEIAKLEREATLSHRIDLENVKFAVGNLKVLKRERNPKRKAKGLTSKAKNAHQVRRKS